MVCFFCSGCVDILALAGADRNHRTVSEGTTAIISAAGNERAGCVGALVHGPPTAYTLTRSADRIVGIAWRVNISPGSAQQLGIVARNPTEPSFGVQWKVHQRFADGTSADWVDPPPARPAPRTRVLPK